jgi:hypothetical protein
MGRLRRPTRNLPGSWTSRRLLAGIDNFKTHPKNLVGGGWFSASSYGCWSVPAPDRSRQPVARIFLVQAALAAHIAKLTFASN